MEAAAMDKLVEKGDLSPQVARAVAEALDITIKAANLATVPTLDARFAQQDAKMEADRKSTRLNSSHYSRSRMPSSA